MAGRGTDIMLGGNAEYSAKERMEKNGATYETKTEDVKKQRAVKHKEHER